MAWERLLVTCYTHPLPVIFPLAVPRILAIDKAMRKFMWFQVKRESNVQLESSTFNELVITNRLVSGHIQATLHIRYPLEIPSLEQLQCLLEYTFSLCKPRDRLELERHRTTASTSQHEPKERANRHTQ